MTPERVAAVKQSFAILAPHAAQAGVGFYGKLCALDPSVRSMFGDDIEAQAAKLMQVLTFAIENLGRPGALMPPVPELGIRHVEYGVTEPQYDVVGAALLATLADGLGERFTPEVRAAWTQAYTILANEMKDAARRAAAT